jgi:hypothetical protein
MGSKCSQNKFNNRHLEGGKKEMKGPGSKAPERNTHKMRCTEKYRQYSQYMLLTYNYRRGHGIPSYLLKTQRNLNLMITIIIIIAIRLLFFLGSLISFCFLSFYYSMNPLLPAPVHSNLEDYIVNYFRRLSYDMLHRSINYRLYACPS